MDIDISVIIIGLNVEKYLQECIESVLKVNYNLEKIEIFYVDGGSKDRSKEIARQYQKVNLVSLETQSPTPGLGRNAGARLARGKFLQFMDADTLIDPDWFNKAIPYLNEEVGAIWGRRTEKFPKKNIYHQLGDFEWAIMGDGSTGFQNGPCRSFGGDALMFRSVYEKTRGYDENLVAGEDPDFSFQVRHNGFKIYRINEPMTIHDLNMNHFRQYWKRSFRTGHAYAEIGIRYLLNTERLFLREFLRIIAGILIPFLFFTLGLVFDYPNWGFGLGFGFFFRPMLKIPTLRKKSGAGFSFLSLYCLHLSFVIVPQFLGVCRYLLTFLGFPGIRNKI